MPLAVVAKVFVLLDNGVKEGILSVLTIHYQYTNLYFYFNHAFYCHRYSAIEWNKRVSAPHVHAGWG